MNKLSLVALSMLAVGFSTPARGAEQLDPAVIAAADKMLSTMPNDWYQVEPAAAQQLIENAKPLVLDMREPAEITSKIPGSLNIPIRQLTKQLSSLPENRAAPILTYCKVGYRGGMAVTILRMLGYTNVRTIKFGLDAWEKAGLAVEKLPPAEKKS